MPKLNLIADSIPDDIVAGGKQKFIDALQDEPLPGLDGQAVAGSSVCQLITELADSYRGGLVESGLWLVAGELDRSHTISQSVESTDGSYWHGIMHRREGDFSNAKYWVRRTGQHQVHQQLASHISAEAQRLSSLARDISGLTDASSLPMSLVDCTETALSNDGEYTDQLKLVCWWEWQLLFAHCI